MVCSRCEQELPEGSTFCMKCFLSPGGSSDSALEQPSEVKFTSASQSVMQHKPGADKTEEPEFRKPGFYLFSAKGRINRVKYFYAVLIFSVGVLLDYACFLLANETTAAWCFCIALFLFLAVLLVFASIKRLHDMDWGGKGWVILFIPLWNIFFLGYMLFTETRACRFSRGPKERNGFYWQMPLAMMLFPTLLWIGLLGYQSRISELKYDNDMKISMYFPNQNLLWFGSMTFETQAKSVEEFPEQYRVGIVNRKLFKDESFLIINGMKFLHEDFVYEERFRVVANSKCYLFEYYHRTDDIFSDLVSRLSVLLSVSSIQIGEDAQKGPAIEHVFDKDNKLSMDYQLSCFMHPLSFSYECHLSNEKPFTDYTDADFRTLQQTYAGKESYSKVAGIGSEYISLYSSSIVNIEGKKFMRVNYLLADREYRRIIIGVYGSRKYIISATTHRNAIQESEDLFRKFMQSIRVGDDAIK